MFHWTHDAQQRLEDKLFAHVEAASFPCVGAKSALARGRLTVLACDTIDSAWDDLRIHDGLLQFAQAYRDEPAAARKMAS